MLFKNFFNKVSEAPTNPKAVAKQRQFDVADLYADPIQINNKTQTNEIPLDEKLRQAYFWIVNHAIISPHYDIEYNNESPQSYIVGDRHRLLTFPSDQSYSSYVLLPLLTFATRRKCLFVGGPGRGKTASAILMGVLAGYPIKEVKRAMQHGHPQMTIADLLGNPLPADLINAKSMDEIKISWRSWLNMRVKVIDEYNRIPTRTQSALLTVMGDNYAEILNHVFDCPEAAWYLTANDDQGGGTYQVIEALRDRIDVIVQALAFNPRFLDDLLVRIEENFRPEDMVPRTIIFKEEEITQLGKEILQVEIPEEVRRRLEFFTSQFEYFEPAGAQFEYMTKDTARLSKIDWAQIIATDNGKDRLKDIGTQTKNGLSVRNLMTLLSYTKAIAFFRGNKIAHIEDVRQILPFVLQDKLHPDLDAPFFSKPENTQFKTDRISWLRNLFDLSNDEFNRLDLDHSDEVGELSKQFKLGLEGLSEMEVKKRLAQIEKIATSRAAGKKVYGPIYDDLLKLKYLHQRYLNYLYWLRSK